MVSVTNTSVGNKIITGSASELLVGMILNCDTDSSDAVAIWKSLVGASNISVTLGGSDTTKGGLKGDWVRFTCLNATTWNVEGNTMQQERLRHLSLLLSFLTFSSGDTGEKGLAN